MHKVRLLHRKDSTHYDRIVKNKPPSGGENGMDKKDKSKVEMIEAVSHLIFSISITLLTLVTVAVIISEHF